MRLAGFTVMAALAAPLSAQPSATLSQAIQAGQVGESYDGYMGFAVTPSPAVRRQVQAINIQRRNLYLQLAARRNVTADVVGTAAACQLMRQLTPGEAYRLDDGIWRRWTSGEPAPLPPQCG